MTRTFDHCNLHLSLSLSLSLYLYRALPLSLSLYLSLPLPLAISLDPSVPHTLSHARFLVRSLSLSPSLSRIVILDADYAAT